MLSRQKLKSMDRWLRDSSGKKLLLSCSGAIVLLLLAFIGLRPTAPAAPRSVPHAATERTERTTKVQTERQTEEKTRVAVAVSHESPAPSPHVRKEWTSFRRPSENVLELLHEESLCAKPLHLGLSDSEGGWNLCGPLPKGCTVLSFGIGNHFSFDIAADKEWGCVVHGFDPTIDEAKVRPEYDSSPSRHLHMVGVGPKTGFFGVGEAPVRWPGEHSSGKPVNSKPWQMETVSDTYKRLGLTRVNVFKMDTEGGEWFALEEFARLNFYDRFDQILLEVHFRPEKYTLSDVLPGGKGGLRITRIAEDDMDYLTLLQKLMEAGFHMWRYSWNAYTRTCLELSFVREK